MDNEKVKDKEEKRGIFLGIIGVLTLIVAIIGASFAYFSINAQSEKDAVTVQAASVQIVYNDGDQLLLQDLIPSAQNIAIRTFTRSLGEESEYQECMDDGPNGDGLNPRRLCGVYEFDLTNNGTGDVTFDVNVVQEATEEESADVHKFENLKFILTDITDTDSTVEINSGFLSKLDTDGNYKEISLLDKGDPSYEKLTIGASSTKNYRLFVWLNEIDDAQDYEQGAVFKGTIHIDVDSESNHITGRVKSN